MAFARVNSNLKLLKLFAAAATTASSACHEANVGVSDAGSSSSASDGDLDSSTGTAGRALEIDVPIELCARSPQRQAFGAAPLFYFRSVTRIPSASAALPIDYGVDSLESLSFSIQSSALAAQEHFDIQGQIRVDLDVVPSAIYSVEDAPGWETASFLGEESSGNVAHNFLLQLAQPVGTRNFEIADLEMLDAGRRLDVVSFMEDFAEAGSFRGVETAPCTLENANVDRIDVTLTEGNVSFHTRPAFWADFSGFTIFAEGELNGIAFDVDSYWDLEYASNDLGSNLYGVAPLLAVRFAEHDDGACILVAEPDVVDPRGAYVASVLDCEQNDLFPVTVESIEFVPGGGDHRW